MSFSATQWRDLLADYSGSTNGTRSWGELGQGQFQGKYYIQTIIAGNNLIARVRGCGGGIGKTVQSFYSVNSRAANYFTAFNGYYGFFSNFQYASGTLYSTPAYVYILGTLLTGLSNSYVSYGSYSQSKFWGSAETRFINSSNYVAFYSYTPWGSGPYSAGSNIAIGHGNNGSPTSGYPYQRHYNSSTLC
jgi:hypothetical protein